MLPPGRRAGFNIIGVFTLLADVPTLAGAAAVAPMRPVPGDGGAGCSRRDVALGDGACSTAQSGAVASSAARGTGRSAVIPVR
jgi:hypothetical protein